MTTTRTPRTARTPRIRPAACCELEAIRPLGKKKQRDWVGVFKALADPTRLEILRLVAAQSAAVCVCDFVDYFDLSQPTISHHLKVLREAGLLEASRSGIWSYYSASPVGQALLRETEGALAATSG